ncbi:ring finger protein dg17-related [Anaeramoeba flamelloides]|uniref:Ring finger protein dg17-related n=1 Tax=Anaeramoeba flamelloides TaxID=1746091 RepID=A0ABQ8YPE0_9EUKA|nr:ring finger protein dg17-related [Anaeramoeba flamelloides]
MSRTKYFYLDKNIDETLICVVCNEPYQEPCTSACNHTFCKDCLLDLFQKDEECPLCGEKFPTQETKEAPFEIQTQVEQLLVRCPNTLYGCEEQIPRCNYHDHLEKCIYNIESCPNQGCDTTYFLRDRDKHKTFCLHQKSPCANGCGLEVTLLEEETHELVCPKAKIKCEFCSEEIIREDLDHHLGTECVKSPIDCIHSKSGCKIKISKEGMKKHLQVCHYHKVKGLSVFSQVSSSMFKIQQTEIDHLQHEMEQLEELVSTLITDKEWIQLETGKKKKAEKLKSKQQENETKNFVMTKTISAPSLRAIHTFSDQKKSTEIRNYNEIFDLNDTKNKHYGDLLYPKENSINSKVSIVKNKDNKPLFKTFTMDTDNNSDVNYNNKEKLKMKNDQQLKIYSKSKIVQDKEIDIEIEKEKEKDNKNQKEKETEKEIEKEKENRNMKIKADILRKDSSDEFILKKKEDGNENKNKLKSKKNVELINESSSENEKEMKKEEIPIEDEYEDEDENGKRKGKEIEKENGNEKVEKENEQKENIPKEKKVKKKEEEEGEDGKEKQDQNKDNIINIRKQKEKEKEKEIGKEKEKEIGKEKEKEKEKEKHKKENINKLIIEKQKEIENQKKININDYTKNLTRIQQSTLLNNNLSKRLSIRSLKILQGSQQLLANLKNQNLPKNLKIQNNRSRINYLEKNYFEKKNQNQNHPNKLNSNELREKNLNNTNQSNIKNEKRNQTKQMSGINGMETPSGVCLFDKIDDMSIFKIMDYLDLTSKFQFSMSSKRFHSILQKSPKPWTTIDFTARGFINKNVIIAILGTISNARSVNLTGKLRSYSLNNLKGLFKRVFQFPNLEELKLSKNFCNKLAEVMDQFLPQNSTLKRLDISWNFLRGGINSIANSIKNNTSLTYLDVTQNYAKCEGAIALSNVLSNFNNTLSHLIISANNIKADGALAILEMLKVNTSIKSIDISFNSMGYDLEKQIKSILSEKK